MDEQFLFDIRKILEDGLEVEDWNCVVDVIDMIRDIQGDFDDDDEY